MTIYKEIQNVLLCGFFWQSEFFYCLKEFSGVTKNYYGRNFLILLISWESLEEKS